MENNATKYKREYTENIRNKKTMKEVTKEIRRCKEQLSSIKVSSKDKQQTEFQTRINQLLKKQAELNEVLSQKARTVQELETKAESDKTKQESITLEAAELKKKIEKCEDELAKVGNTKWILPAIQKEEIEKMSWILKLSFMEEKILPTDIRKVLLLLYESLSITTI